VSNRQRILLADTQTIFRRGAARVLAAEAEFEVVGQCSTEEQLQVSIAAAPESIVVFSAAMVADVMATLEQIEKAQSKSVVIVERGTRLNPAAAQRAQCVLLRSVAGSQLVNCLRKVAAGERFVTGERLSAARVQDETGVRILKQLTPKELQIMALVVDGGKNREIATALGTKEQVVKNYLRSIYDKTGVSDRLELAIFVAHHAALAEAAVEARRDIPAKR
jgi:DNA-binding NarL/FixJ family response regulator